MATREEVLTNLTKAAKQGNIRDAYRDFEELPFVDQVAISISPGIGDALAVYEIGEFGARGAKNIEEKDFLGALGNYGLSGLSAISILPLFRLFRGAKAIKTIDPVIDAPRPRKGKTGLKGPGEYQAEQAAKKTTENLPLPKVEEFKPLSLNEMVYPGTLGRTIKNQGLTSKAAKFINTSNKLPVQGKLITYINALEKAGVPKGELRLLNILDEANEIHPKLLDEMGSKSGLDKITRQRLSQYIKTNQKDAISKRMVAKNKYSRQIKELGDEFANIKENTFHVRGITRKEFDHYSEAPHKDHFVFDSTSEFKLPNIPETEKITEFIGGDNFLNVARVQSDYAEEMGILAKNRSESQIDSIKRSIDASADRRVINNMAEYKLPSDKPGGERINMENFAIKIARENPQITSPEKLRELFIKKAGDKGATRESFGPFGNDFSIDDVFPLEAFETIQKAVEKAQKKFPVTPYIDGKAITSLKKALNQYNNAIPEINNLSLKQADLQKKIDSLELTPDSPSIVDLNKELDQIKKTRDDLIGEKVVPNIDEFGGFTLSPEELKNITGKPFTESLGKSLDEIFYELEAIKPGSPAVRQKYGPGTPGERALNYFNEIVNNDKMTFDIGNGINILKRATKIKPDKFSGYPIDPYAKGTRTNYIKLPIRSNFLEAVEEGKDGMYFDSAAKRLGKEGGWESELLQGVFREGENEIDRIIRELGLDPKDYVLKPKDIEFKGPGYKFDGTYVKIDEALRKLVKEKGIDAFKDGGAVDDDLPDVQPVQSNYATYQDRQGFESGGVVEEAAKLAAARARIDLDIENEARVEAGLLPLPPLLDNPPVNYATEEDLAKSTYAADAAKEAKNYARQVEIAKYNDPHLYEIYSIEDPETRQRALDEYKDFSVFRDILPFIPINVKQYAYHMAGGKGDVDINDLTKKEQEAYYRYAQEIMASGELPLDQDSSVMMDYPNYGTKEGYADVVPIKNLGLSDEQLEAWKRGELVIKYPGGRNGAVESYSYEEFLEKYPGALDSDGQSIGDLITNMQDPNYVAKTFTGKADINYNKDSNTITVTDNYNHNRGPKATTKGIIEAFKADPSLYAALKAGAVLKNADGSVIELDLGSPQFVQGYPTGKATGGPVDESKLEQTERRLDAGEEIDDILKDLYGTAIANEFGEFDYKAPLNKFKDSIENSFSNYQDSIEKNLSNQFDFKYKDDLMDIYKSDDPGANIENRARKFSTNSINSLLDDLNLPVDVRRDNYGTSFDKRINVAPNTNVTLDAYKSDDGDFTGDLNLRYSNRGKYGNIDLQSAINELGDTQDKIKYTQDIGPFSIQAGKTSGRDATGSVSYNLPSMSVGNAQTIQARAVVDNLLNAKGQLDYMYNNPNTGYFVNAGLGLNSQRGPEFNLKFGKNF
jgi:hypothetical protein